MELKAAKKAWEFYHMKELKEKEAEMLWEEEEEELLTYTREDAYNKVMTSRLLCHLIAIHFWCYAVSSLASFELLSLFAL